MTQLPNPNYLVDAIRRQQAEIEAEMSVVPKAVSPDQFLTPQDLAGLFAVSTRTLEAWRKDGRGPRVTRIAKMPRYRYRDVIEWVQAQNPEQP